MPLTSKQLWLLVFYPKRLGFFLNTDSSHVLCVADFSFNERGATEQERARDRKYRL